MISKNKHISGIKKLLEENFKDEISNIILFGSQVFNANEDSDFDILIITEEKMTWNKRSEVNKILFDYEVENEILIHPIFFTSEEYNSTLQELPLIKNRNLYLEKSRLYLRT